MNKALYFSLIFCFFFLGKNYSQSDSLPDLKLDSLLNLVESVENQDTTYVDNLIELGMHFYGKYDLANARKHLLEAEKLAFQLEVKGRLINIYFLLSRSDLGINKYNELIRNIQLNLNDLSEFNTQGLYDFMNIAIGLNWRKRFSESLDIIFHVENEFKKRSNPEVHLSQISNIKREVYVKMKDFEKAKATSIESLNYANVSKNEQIMALAELSHVWLQVDLENYTEATKGYLQILQDSSKLKFLQKETIYSGLGEVALIEKKYEAAVNYYEEAIRYSNNEGHINFLKLEKIKAKIGLNNDFYSIKEFYKIEDSFIKIKDDDLLADYYFEKGNFLSNNKRFDEAIVELNKSLEHSDRIKSRESNTNKYIELLESLVETNLALENYEEAFLHQKNLLEVKQKIIDEESALKGMQYATNQILEKNKNEKILLQQKNEVQQKLLWGAGIAAFLFLIFGAVIWNQSKQLSKEKKKSEELLFNMLPVSIANRMQKGELTIADKYKEATVIFIDMANFTKISSSQPPEEILQLLNVVFSKIDHLTEKFHLEKIKTIGDCYMAVSGIPQPSENHLINAIEFCFAILKEFEGMEYQNQQIDFRIGVETGPVVAGVIGEKRFLFDLWGDTVNTASRMEAHGVLGKIQTTRNVYNKMKNKYDFHSRGLVDIKGKGQMEVFLLEEKKN